MNTLNCLVVDDEQLARTLLETYIARLPHLHLVKSCKSPGEALVQLQEQKIDLLFLDIQMPELTGVELLKTLTHKPLIVFTTAYPEYALEGYELDVTDYLLKPFGFDRFVQAVNKATEQMRLRHLAQQANQNTGDNPSQTEAAKDYLLVKADHKVHKIFYNDILYIQGMREYVLFFTSNGKIMSLLSMKSLEKELPAQQFTRIHKSYIVANQRVRVLEGNRVIIGEEKLPIGNHYKEQVMERIFK